MKNKINSISLIRALAILGVVLIHSVPNQNNMELDLFSARTFTFISSIMRWSVPAFVMITGALLLPRCESFKKCMKRAGRILVILAVFGFVMAMLQNIFESGLTLKSVLLSFKDVISGDTWDVMWYLYMLVGLYLFMPFVNIFVKHAERKDIEFILILLFVFTSVIETVNMFFKNSIGFYIPSDSVYLFYLLAGYYIFTYRPKINKYMALVAVFAVAAVFFALSYYFVKPDAVENIVGYKSPLTVVLSLCIFILLVDTDIDSKVVDLIADNSFGIYLIHCFYIHFIDKIFGIYELPYNKIALMVPLYLTVVAASLITSIIIRKIPFVKKFI